MKSVMRVLHFSLSCDRTVTLDLHQKIISYTSSHLSSQIQKESGARVKFFDREDEKDESSGPNSQRMLVIMGTAEAAQQAELMIHQV